MGDKKYGGLIMVEQFNIQIKKSINNEYIGYTLADQTIIYATMSSNLSQVLKECSYNVVRYGL